MNILIDLVEIPAGSFVFGADKNDGRAEPREMPMRVVWLDGYFIQRTPVTVKLWRMFLSETQYIWNHWADVEVVCLNDNFPIVCVSWHDCDAFIRWLNRSLHDEGGEFSLPTEAEWEKSCRGVDAQLFPWGNQELEEWDSPLELDIHYATRVEVESYAEYASPFGCLGMLTNVAEWCKDWYQQDYYQNMPLKNPEGPASGEYRSLRGGSPAFGAGWPTCYNRGCWQPDERTNAFGFRVVFRKWKKQSLTSWGAGLMSGAWG